MEIEQLIMGEDDSIIANYKGKFSPDDHLYIFCFFEENIKLRQQQLLQIKKYFKNAIITGCSGAGEIAQDIIYDNKMVVSLIKFTSHENIKIIYRPVHKGKSHELGKEIAGAANQIKNLTGIVIFSDGLNLDGTKFSAGLSLGLNLTVPIIGGMAGDGVHFSQTYTIIDGEIKKDMMAILFLSNQIKMMAQASGGWNRFGFEHTITKVIDNVVYQIDGMNALDFYKEHLGSEASKLPASGLHFPLLILENDTSEAVVRTLLAVDEKEKSLTFAGSIGLGSKVDLMKSSSGDLINASHKNVDKFKETFSVIKSNKEKINIFSLIISCVGRRLALGQKTEEELLAHEELTHAHITQSGFYSYGEISSSRKEKCTLHNQTLTQAFIWED